MNIAKVFQPFNLFFFFFVFENEYSCFYGSFYQVYAQGNRYVNPFKLVNKRNVVYSSSILISVKFGQNVGDWLQLHNNKIPMFNIHFDT
jgi:hypothetical protein